MHKDTHSHHTIHTHSHIYTWIDVYTSECINIYQIEERLKHLHIRHVERVETLD